MWNKTIKSMLVLAMVLAPWAASAGPQSISGARVYYLFSPEQTQERQRAVQLERRLREDAANLQLIAVARGTDVQFPAGIVVLDAEAVARADLPGYIRARLTTAGDFFAVVDEGGDIRATGSGSRLGDIFAIATDVEVKTWAKIKDLFD